MILKYQLQANMVHGCNGSTVGKVLLESRGFLQTIIGFGFALERFSGSSFYSMFCFL